MYYSTGDEAFSTLFCIQTMPVVYVRRDHLVYSYQNDKKKKKKNVKSRREKEIIF